MHAHIVHAHPDAHSYNAALKDAAQSRLEHLGHSVTTSDLYALGFDPVEKAEHYTRPAETETFSPLREQRHAWETNSVPNDVSREISYLERCDLLILQFPLWWHGSPAILKGWMDRVFLSGGLYTSRMRYDAGYFKGRRAILSVTTGAPRAAFGPGCRGGDLETMLWPLQYSLHYMGFSILAPFISYGVQGHGYSYEDEHGVRDRLSRNLKEWTDCLSLLEEKQELAFPGWDDWDEDGCALQRTDLSAARAAGR